MKQLDEKVILRNVLITAFGFFILFGLLTPILVISVRELDLAGSNKLSLTWMFIGFVLLYFLFILLSWIYNKYSYRFYRYSVEESFLKIEKGIIWKTFKTLPFKKIQNIDISRGVLDRILGLSNLCIQTAGNVSYQRQVYEGLLPGLSVQTAQELQQELTKKVSLSS